MGISPTILISRIFASIIIFILQSLLLRYLSKRDLINTKLLINISFLFAFILCLPFEFPFTITVPSKRIMPLIYKSLLEMCIHSCLIIKSNSLSENCKSGNIIIGLNKPITIGASGILSLNM